MKDGLSAGNRVVRFIRELRTNSDSGWLGVLYVARNSVRMKLYEKRISTRVLSGCLLILGCLCTWLGISVIMTR